MANIDYFNECAAELLSRLYESFPVGLEIDVENYPQYKGEKSEMFFATINFLRAEDFIRIESEFYGGYTGVCLTAKGFTVLTSPAPDVLGANTTLGSRIKEILSTGKVELIKEVIRESIRLLTL